MDHTLGHDRASDRLASGVFVDCCPAHSKGMLIELSGKRVLPEQAHISSSFSSVCVCVCCCLDDDTQQWTHSAFHCLVRRAISGTAAFPPPPGDHSHWP